MNQRHYSIGSRTVRDYGYIIAGTGQARWRRMPILDRIRLWHRRQRVDDLAGLKEWMA
jgi:hypothetical protein